MIKIKRLPIYVELAHNEGFSKSYYRYINPCLVDIYHKKMLIDHDTKEPRTCYYVKYQDKLFYIDENDLREICVIE